MAAIAAIPAIAIMAFAINFALPFGLRIFPDSFITNAILPFVGPIASAICLSAMFFVSEFKVVTRLFGFVLVLVAHTMTFFASYLATYAHYAPSLKCAFGLSERICKRYYDFPEFIHYLATHHLNKALDKNGPMPEVGGGILDVIMNLIPIALCQLAVRQWGEIASVGYICLGLNYLNFLMFGIVTIIGLAIALD